MRGPSTPQSTTGHYTVLDNSRRANAATCRCGAAVLAGIDRDRCALNATVDPEPLTRAGEWLAVLAGRVTYELTDRLYRRDRWSIRTEPRGDAVAEHRCEQPLPASWRAPVAAPVTRTADPDRLEF